QLELCKQRASLLGMWRNPEKEGLVRMFLRCMKSPGGLKRMLDTFFSVRRLQASLMRVSELKVAMEESQKVKAKLVLMDQDIDVLSKQFGSISINQNINYRRLNDMNHIDTLKKWFMLRFFPEITPRSNMEGIRRWFYLIFPEHHRVIFIERDIFMFIKLRRLEDKVIVAVVGLGHMNGIEILWKYAEDFGDD
ncbi:hypothetical protein C5167_018229, partial [Papaver somniferum]